jgi:hypothetical protein
VGQRLADPKALGRFRLDGIGKRAISSLVVAFSDGNPVSTFPENAPNAARPRWRAEVVGLFAMAGALALAPAFVYPLLLMKALCFALFACAFNLLIGYVGLLSFGHALFFGWASYVSAHAAAVWGLTPELAILAGSAAGAARRAPPSAASPV